MNEQTYPANGSKLSKLERPGLPRPTSLRSRLVWLVLSLLVPALGASAVLIWSSSQHAIRSQERQLMATARIVSIVVDRQLSEQAGLLKALGSSYRLRAGDWASFDLQARRALDGVPSWIAVRTMDGQQLVNTLRPPGTPLPKVTLPRVAANRPPRPDGLRVADLATGALAREPVLVVVKEVRLDNGQLVDLSIVTRASAFSSLLRRQGLPDTWTETLLDGRHRIIARSRDEARFRGATASPALTRHLGGGASGLIWSRTLDGIETRTAFQPVQGSDWTVVIAVPKDELERPARQALGAGAVAAIGLLLIGIGMAAESARRIGAAVRGLQAAAAANLTEAFVEPKPTGITEIDELARAFQRSSRRAAEHDAKQRLLINELNHRVKNSLATVQAVSSHSRRTAGDVEAFHEALEGRIMAMSTAHELLTLASWDGANLRDLAGKVLLPFASDQLLIAGPSVQVPPTDALNLSLILFELATNAQKHGALSTPAGRVSLVWRQDGGLVRMEWVESGGPPVRASPRRGFGTRLLSTARAGLSPSSYELLPQGVRCTLTLRLGDG